MTIAVGAKFPWDSLNSMFPMKPKSGEAVVLASDCRISEKRGDRYFPKCDLGTKIFKIGTDVAAVYAGISVIGENCIDELRWRLAKQQPGSAASRKTAQEIFQNVYRHNLALRKMRPDQAPLYFIIGACSKSGRAELYKSSYNSDFALEEITGLKVIAWPDTKDVFDNLLNKELAHHAKLAEQQYSHLKDLPELLKCNPQTSINVEQLGLLLVSVLTRVIEFSKDETIGGKVQYILITNKGVTTPLVIYPKNGIHQNSKWNSATANQDGLNTQTGISNTFGFYNLSD